MHQVKALRTDNIDGLVKNCSISSVLTNLPPDKTAAILTDDILKWNFFNEKL